MNAIKRLVIAAMLLFITGCGGLGAGELHVQPDSAAPAPVLKVLYGTSEIGSEAVIDAARKYEQLTGIAVEIRTFTYQNLQGKVISELSRKSGEYDLIALDASWVPKIIQHLEPLSEYIRHAENPSAIALDDFIPNVLLDASVFAASAPHRMPSLKEPITLDGVTAEGFDIYSLPIQANVLMGSYRKDLFQNKQEKERFRQQNNGELAPPATLEEYLTLAQYFTRPSAGEEGNGLYGTTLMAAAHESLFIEFQAFLAAYGGTILDEKLRPAFQLDPGIKALTTYGSWINQYQVTPPDVLSYTWEEAGTAFGSGQAAMGLNYHEMELDPRIRTGAVGYFMFPAADRNDEVNRTPQIISWGLSVNKYSSNKAEAYKLAEYLTSPAVQKDALRFKHNVTRQSAYEQAQNLLFSAQREYYDVLGRSLAQGTVRPRLTNYKQISEVMQAAVRDYLIGKKNAADALGDAARQVETLMKQAGY